MIRNLKKIVVRTAREHNPFYKNSKKKCKDVKYTPGELHFAQLKSKHQSLEPPRIYQHPMSRHYISYINCVSQRIRRWPYVSLLSAFNSWIDENPPYLT